MSLIDLTYQDEVNKLIACFDDTEKKVKHLEQDTFELAIPSINQLRYVAYHILKASDPTKNEDIDAVKDEIKKALNHCQRAKFDAVEIWITYLLEEIRSFEETYSHIKETQDAIKDYAECLSKAQQAADELKSISDDEKNREEYYKKIDPHYKSLKEVVNKLKKAKPLIATLVEANNKKKKKDTRRFVITTILGLIGLILLASRLGFVDTETEKPIKSVENSEQPQDSQ